MNTGISILNLLSMLILGAAIVVVAARKSTFLNKPLIITAASILLVTALTNFLEYASVTDQLDPVEDLLEMLFLPVFIFAIYASLITRELAIKTANEQKLKAYKTDLSISEKRFKALVEHSSDGILIISSEDRPVYASPSLQNILGYTRDEILKKDIFQLVHPDNREMLKTGLHEIRDSQEKSKSGITIRVLHKDQSYRFLATSLTNLKDDPAIQGTIMNWRDVTEQVLSEKNTERRSREKELKTINDRFKLALKAANEAIWEWDILNEQILWSDGYEKIFKRSAIKDMNPENWRNNIMKSDREAVLKSLEDCLSNPAVEVWQYDYRYIKGDEDVAWVEARGFVLRDENGKPTKIIGSMTDITERRMFQERLMESIIRTQEQERNRIAKDLHDGIVQELVACGMKAELIRLTENTDKRNEGLSDLLDQIKKTTNNTRNLSHGLLSADMNSMNLSELVDRLAFQLNSISSIEFSVSNKLYQPQIINEEVKINLYRVLQEITSNIIKHSAASAAHIRIEQSDHEMHVSVKDNGVGIKKDKIPEITGIGLYSIHKRIKTIGGSITYSSPEDGGLQTDIHVNL